MLIPVVPRRDAEVQPAEARMGCYDLPSPDLLIEEDDAPAGHDEFLPAEWLRRRLPENGAVAVEPAAVAGAHEACFPGAPVHVAAEVRALRVHSADLTALFEHVDPSAVEIEASTGPASRRGLRRPGFGPWKYRKARPLNPRT
jgi:hypothetical protein